MVRVKSGTKLDIYVNYSNIIAECLFNPNSILFVDYDRLSHSGT